MKRRAFLAGLAAAPWWIRRAFADASVGDAHPGPAAPATTGPTLVFVVPRDEGRRWERGAAFGDYLNKGSDRDLAPLALVDVVCAPAARFGIGGDPWMLLVVGRSVRVLGGPDGAPKAGAIAALVREVLPLHGKSAGELAAVARQRYVNKAPRGARWGRTTMCGNEYEEGPSEQVDCGMGHVPEVSRRFLDFYVKKS